MFGHMMLSRVWPEMAISEAEALELARAYVNLRKHYPGVIDPKTAAWIGLLMVVGTIDGTRALRAMAHVKAVKAQAAAVRAGEATAGGTVVNLESKGR